jgi:hypothetical protein
MPKLAIGPLETPSWVQIASGNPSEVASPTRAAVCVKDLAGSLEVSRIPLELYHARIDSVQFSPIGAGALAKCVQK